MSDYQSATNVLLEAFHKVGQPTVVKESVEPTNVEKPESTEPSKVVETADDVTKTVDETAEVEVFDSPFNSLCENILKGSDEEVYEEMDHDMDYDEDEYVMIPRALAEELNTYLDEVIGQDGETELEDGDFEELEEMVGDHSGKPVYGKKTLAGSSQKGSHKVTGSVTGKVSNSGNNHVGGNDNRDGRAKVLAKSLKSQLSQTGKKYIYGKASRTGKNGLNNN